MSTALQHDVPPQLAPACDHSDFVEYTRSDDDPTDDTYTMKGRCIAEDAWYELWISRSTGEVWSERALDSDEIAAFRRAEMF